MLKYNSNSSHIWVLSLLLILLSINYSEAQALRKNFQLKKRNKIIGSFRGNTKYINREISYYSIGGGGSAINYFGDMAPTSGIASTDISFTRPAINIFFKQNINGRYSWKSNLMWGSMQASDIGTIGSAYTSENANRYLRNLSFKNNIVELSALGEVYLFKHMGRYISRPVLNVYAFLGVAMIYHNPKGLVPEYFSLDPYQANLHNDNGQRYFPLENAGEWFNLRPLGTEGQFASEEIRKAYREFYEKELPKPYSRFQIVIPAGIGAKYRLSNRLDVTMQIGYRHTFTDYLDDVSGEYVDLGVFGDPNDKNAALAMAMSDKSNQFSEDEFNSINKFTYVPIINEVNSLINQELSYLRAAGYGSAAGIGNDDVRRNIRGNQEDNDIYIVTNLSLAYILPAKSVGRFKAR